MRIDNLELCLEISWNSLGCCAFQIPGVYLEDHPRTWIRGDRITPIYFRHEVRPCGRGPTTRSLGDETDHQHTQGY